MSEKERRLGRGTCWGPETQTLTPTTRAALLRTLLRLVSWGSGTGGVGHVLSRAWACDMTQTPSGTLVRKAVPGE